MLTKVCACCGQAKPHLDFTPRKTSRDGLGSYCRPCNNAKIKARRDADREAYRAKAAAAARARYAQDSSKVRQNSANWRSRNPDDAKTASRESKARARASNPDTAKSKARTWNAANREKVRVWEARRRAMERHAVTEWDRELDSLVIAEAYDLRKLRTEATGYEWHVDHVVPLTNPHVCGLHNAHNLEVVPASYNCSKRNKFDESLVQGWQWL